jgi:hypothetical protein
MQNCFLDRRGLVGRAVALSVVLAVVAVGWVTFASAAFAADGDVTYSGTVSYARSYSAVPTTADCDSGGSASVDERWQFTFSGATIPNAGSQSTDVPASISGHFHDAIACPAEDLTARTSLTDPGTFRLFVERLSNGQIALGTDGSSGLGGTTFDGTSSEDSAAAPLFWPPNESNAGPAAKVSFPIGTTTEQVAVPWGFEWGDGSSHADPVQTQAGTLTISLTSSQTPPSPPSDTDHPPTAHSDTITTLHGLLAKISPLTNDTDPDHDPLSIVSWAQGRNGKVSCTATVCAYAPKPSFDGIDSFAYTMSDGRGGTSSARVFLRVPPVRSATDRGKAKASDGKPPKVKKCSVCDRPAWLSAASGRVVAQSAGESPFRYWVNHSCNFSGGGDEGVGSFYVAGAMMELGSTGVNDMKVEFRVQAYGENFFGQYRWVTQKTQGWDTGEMSFPDADNVRLPGGNGLMFWRESLPNDAVGNPERVQVEYEWKHDRRFLPDQTKAKVDWTTLCDGTPDEGY